jgi:hypothetical protein
LVFNYHTYCVIKKEVLEGLELMELGTEFRRDEVPGFRLKNTKSCALKKNTVALLGFWILSFVRNSKNYKTQRFGN